MRAHEKIGGFTLLELLVVVGLIATLSLVLVRGLGGGRTAALQSAQATFANLVTAARTRAVASGRSVRVLVNIDQNSNARPLRFLRCIVLQAQSGSAWQTVTTVYLPDGIYVVPGNFAVIPAGLFAAGTASPWTRSDGSALRSTVLRSNLITTEAIDGPVTEQWASFTIAATGTTAQSGDIILATGRQRSPGSFAAGESPVELENPEQVRGVTLSAYGVPAMGNSRASF